MQNQSNQKPMTYEEFMDAQYERYMAQFRGSSPSPTRQDQNQLGSSSRQKSQSPDQNQSPPLQGHRGPRQKSQSPDHYQGQNPNQGHSSGAAAKSKKQPDLFIFYLLGGFLLLWFFGQF